MSKSVKRRVIPTRAYTADLAEPIYEPVHASVDEAEETRFRKLRKLLSLFEFFEIEADPPRNWAALALALAEQHVPGFSVVHAIPPRRGRKRTWKAGLADDLMGEVGSLIGKKKMTIVEAINTLHADPSKIWRRYTKQNLTTRYREARRARKEHLRIGSELAKSGLIAGLGPNPTLRSKSGLGAGLGGLIWLGSSPSNDGK
jgi:hypothetical protein